MISNLKEIFPESFSQGTCITLNDYNTIRFKSTYIYIIVYCSIVK